MTQLLLSQVQLPSNQKLCQHNEKLIKKPLPDPLQKALGDTKTNLTQTIELPSVNHVKFVFHLFKRDPCHDGDDLLLYLITFRPVKLPGE